MAQQVLSEAALVHQLSSRFQSDRAETSFLAEQVTTSRAVVESLRHRSDKTESLLRQEALFSYTDEVPEASTVGQFGGSLVELAAQHAYLSLTLGDIAGTLSQLQAEQSQLVRANAAVRQQLRHELETGMIAAAQRNRALQEAAALQVMLSQAQSQVALLAAAAHPATGLPVGNGIVNAVNEQLGTAPAGNARLVASTASVQATTTPSTAEAGTDQPTTTLGSSSSATATSTPAPSTSQASPVATTTALPATTTTALPVTTTVAPATTTTAPPTTIPVTTTAAVAPASTASSGEPSPAAGVWLELRECESGDNYQTDTGNGFYGAYQFAEATWTGLGLSGVPSEAPYWVQDEAAQRLQAQYGWGPWPACSAALGL